MAGYSGTPLAKKLGIKESSRVVLVGAPADFETTLEPLPPGAVVSRRMGSAGSCDVIILFAPNAKTLTAKFDACRAALRENGGLWIAWPKRSSGVPTDLTESPVRELGLASGLVDNKVCAIDETWSGLRFVVRLKDRK